MATLPGNWPVVKEVMVALLVLILWDFQPGTFFFQPGSGIDCKGLGKVAFKAVYCPNQGTACDDHNPATTNDQYNDECECEASISWKIYVKNSLSSWATAC
ncbi:MAG: hypothetical protein IPJ54_21000 [Saprospiraceae bacterium]|nr:hypothetical protein [Saprospiraceae bacterium]